MAPGTALLRSRRCSIHKAVQTCRVVSMETHPHTPLTTTIRARVWPIRQVWSLQSGRLDCVCRTRQAGGAGWGALLRINSNVGRRPPFANMCAGLIAQQLHWWSLITSHFAPQEGGPRVRLSSLSVTARRSSSPTFPRRYHIRTCTPWLPSSLSFGRVSPAHWPPLQTKTLLSTISIHGFRILANGRMRM
jgi:hypothetical protein